MPLVPEKLAASFKLPRGLHSGEGLTLLDILFVRPRRDAPEFTVHDMNGEELGVLPPEAVLDVIYWDALGPTGDVPTRAEVAFLRDQGLEAGVYWEACALVALPVPDV